MSWVAVIGAGAAVAGKAIEADSKSNAGSSGSAAPSGLGFTTASAASYGTTIGNDGWSINFGSGSQTANPVKTTTSSYPQEKNPLSALQPVTVLQGQSCDSIGGISSESVLLLAVGALVAVKLLRQK